jgi:hypothetical protein
METKVTNTFRADVSAVTLNGGLTVVHVCSDHGHDSPEGAALCGQLAIRRNTPNTRDTVSRVRYLEIRSIVFQKIIQDGKEYWWRWSPHNDYSVAL